MTLEEIQREIVRSLDEQERHELTWFLYHLKTSGDNEQPPEEVEEAWNEEITKRIREIEDGTVKTIPGEVFLENLRRPLKQNV
ncbi:MAG: addiction module protein [Verrucomicrobiales bacterium]